ncbi:DUF3068 domain-containing protein [Sphaerisporangium sp. TRM90804]|uniref:DUF3068 domain-containing protein n=1 Tax=Sphaerisporangium sp. TRM90804 TaxID=3031113 RepID=UPI002447A8E0|nr:DUF3068 domain-containing protein [Sphaerisporangium sp. TRM90804]MDH2427909.1 DUF3068 domain-containing protein [Sphaerisporangium sp. TRM90804]
MLITIGAFLVTLAPLMRFYAADRLISAPADQYVVTKLQAEDAQYFSTGDLKVLTGNLDITVTTRGDVAAATGDQVVWDEFTAVNDVTNNRQGISFNQRRSAFNRYTGEGVNCCGSNVEKEPVNLSGQVYLFPFGTQKKAYKVFNGTARQAFEARFVGEETVNGLAVYKFEQSVPQTRTQTLTAPASVLGMTQSGDVQVERFYDGVVTYWVEPTSGVPVKQEQQRHEVLKTEDGVERSVAFVATARMTPATVGELVAKAVDAKGQINLLKVTVPLILLIVGLVFVIAGLLVVARWRSSRRARI